MGDVRQNIDRRSRFVRFARSLAGQVVSFFFQTGRCPFGNDISVFAINAGSGRSSNKAISSRVASMGGRTEISESCPSK